MKKWCVLLLLLLLPSVSAVSNVQHSVDGTKVTLTYEGTPPFLIKIRGDDSIGVICTKEELETIYLDKLNRQKIGLD